MAPRANALLLLLLLLLAPNAPAQKDISLETLVGAMEGRLGVYARNLATGDIVAINADRVYPSADIENAFNPPRSEPAGAESRPARAAESRPAERSPRALAEVLAGLHQAWQRGLDHPIRRALVTNLDRALIGPGLSPTIEVGGANGGPPRAPGAAFWASTPKGDVVFCVLTSGLDSAYTARRLFPDVIGACFRRLVPAFQESGDTRRPAGFLSASLHEKNQDPRLFPQPLDPEVARLRPGVQRLRFHPGETARVAVLTRPADPARITVQWWSPAEQAESCASQVLDGGALGDAVFDLPVDKLGRWRVRAALGDVIVLDHEFTVTAR